MQPDDQVAEWLVRWEEAGAAGETLPVLDLLPAELRPRAREGLLLLRGFARLTTTGPAPPADAPQAPPDTPRYRFEAFLGRGGMGEVWRGWDAVLAREVALKVMRQRVLQDSGFKARFEKEARHVGRLEHPSIVPVYDLGELPDGRPFFAMRLVRGQTLAEAFAARATPAEGLPRSVGVFELICDAVAFAHARGVIHRDLKPSNVMLGEFGEVLVMDWGIAKALAARPQPTPLPPAPILPAPSVGGAETGQEGPETLPGQAKGTPAFMAPEQAKGEAGRVGKASDVFGLGGILCVTLTGQPPFTRPGQAPAGDLEGGGVRAAGRLRRRRGSDRAGQGVPGPVAGSPSRGRRGGRRAGQALPRRGRRAAGPGGAEVVGASGGRAGGTGRLGGRGVPPGGRGRPGAVPATYLGVPPR
jgi:tRNA A-37 threonylcarbamoyl transferase component Bud32